MSDDKLIDWREALQRRKEAEASKSETAGQAEKGGGRGDDIDSGFIWECFNANELGDGVLFAQIHKGKFIFNHTAQEWMIWKEHFWARDEMNQAASAVEDITPYYLRLIKELDEKIANMTNRDAKELEEIRKNLLKRIRRLRSERGRVNCLKFAAANNVNALAITSDKFDQNPRLLGVKNGTIDLDTGRLHPGRQSDFISKICPHEWKGREQRAPIWQRSLLEIFNGDDGLVAYIKRLLGYSVSGLNVEHIFPIFYGAMGRNGKGTILETLLYVLGALAAAIQSEMLLDNWKVSSASGPSADVMSLLGLRVAIASETKEGRYIDSAKVKWFCGADTLVGRNPYDKYVVRFSPTHTLFLQTNNVPRAPADDHAFWARVHLIPFQLSFVSNPQAEHERPVDKMLKEKLRAEAPGIISWLVDGFLEWQAIGLDPPPIVLNATNEQRREEDYISDFLDDTCYIDRFAKVQASKLYTRFSQWYQENHDSDQKKTPSQRRFGLMMIKKFKKQKDGVYYYHGLDLIDK
jgi:putative DNA primase/helicase